MFAMPIGSILARKFHPRLVLGVCGFIGVTLMWFQSIMPTFHTWWACFSLTYAVGNGFTFMTPLH